MVQIAVSTIMKNESAHVERWAESARAADLLLLGDTGSTDGSVDLARSCGISVVEMAVTPWRFDVARNTLLSMTPPGIDVVITLDVDEVLVPGWRELLEKTVADNPWARRWAYEYVWNWVPGKEGEVPDVMFRADRCFSREGWRWHGAVHEVLVPAESRGDLEAPAAWAGFRIEHYADAGKSRSSYLELLRQAVREEPHNPRQRFYLGREYFFVGRWEMARQTLVDFLAMPEATWTAERAEAYRYIAKMDTHPERWLLKAVAEAPERRDAVVDLADLYVREERWTEAAGMAARALAVRQRPGDYMSTAAVWDDERLERIVGGIDRG